MAANDKTPIHTAYAFSRQGKKFGKLLECGTGYIVLSPIGAPPPKVEAPTDDEDSEEEF